MDTLITWLRTIIGTPNFYHQMGSGTQSWQWDYSLMFEYCLAGLLVLIVVSNIFSIIRRLIR